MGQDDLIDAAEPNEPEAGHRLQIPSQAALNDLASLENRMNSRMEKFKSVIVNLVSRLTLPSQSAVGAEGKTAMMGGPR